MKASLYADTKEIVFNPSDVCYIIENAYECKTMFKNKKCISLSYCDTKKLLNKFYRVYSYKFGCTIYLNKSEIAMCKLDCWDSEITFKNGLTLTNLSGLDLAKLKINNSSSNTEIINEF